MVKKMASEKKIIKDLKERNDQLANQYRLRDIRCINLENENQRLKQQINGICLLLERVQKFIPLHYPETLLEIKNFLNKNKHND